MADRSNGPTALHIKEEAGPESIEAEANRLSGRAAERIIEGSQTDTKTSSANKYSAITGAPPAGNRMSTPWLVALSFLLTAALGAGGYFTYQALNPKKPAPELVPPAVVTVSLIPAVIKNVDDTIAITGSVHAWDPLSVGTEISGLRIREINVEEGDSVKKGQVLARLNSNLLEAQLAQAKARLLSSEANLKKAIQPNRPEDILSLKAAVAQTEAVVIQEEAHHRQALVNLRNAELNENRYKQLEATGAVSLVDAETRAVTADNARHEILSAERKVESARLQTDQAKQRLLMALHGGRIEDVLISKASIAEIEAQVQHLQEQIKQTIIVAPDDGLISRRDAHIGDTSSAGSPLFAMIRMNRIELRAPVSDLDLPRFKVGQEVLVSSTEAESSGIRGKVRLISPQVDAGTRMGMVRIDLPSDAVLKPGMFVRGEVKLAKKLAVTVPVNSVVNTDGESFVFTLDGTRAVAHKVHIGARMEDCIEIKDGIKANELIVDKGARFLNDRDVVRIGK